MTSVAALKAVEIGKLDLDDDVRPKFPSMGQHGIITGFDDEKNEATFEPLDPNAKITTRMLLCHTSGHEYDWLNPHLGKWRASWNEVAWSGPTVEAKSAIPLTSQPGTKWAYGGGNDWAGKVIELAMGGQSLEEFMREHIWVPLGIDKDVSFLARTNPEMKGRVADIVAANETGQGPALVDAGDEFDMLFGGDEKECFGGAGIVVSTEAYFTFLSAVFRRDERLLKKESYEELFRPQLDERCEQSLNDFISGSPSNERFLALGVPSTVRKTWSLAGMVCMDKQEGRFEEGAILWAGVPNALWFMDPKGGVCGTAVCQLIPPQLPGVIALHEQFQREVLLMAKN